MKLIRLIKNFLTGKSGGKPPSRAKQGNEKIPLPFSASKLPPPVKRRAVLAVRKEKRNGGIARTAQQTLPYVEMYRDGICRVTESHYTKTIEFFDINYQLAQNEDKDAIFESWCDCLNYFDSSIPFQLSFVNHQGDMEALGETIHIPDQQDSHNNIRREYREMLAQQLARGNNGLVRRKFITFGIDADSPQTAKLRLERIESDITGNLKSVGVSSRPMNGTERLKLLHGILHPEGGDRFRFHWDLIAHTGLTSKDFIAPSSFSFSRDGQAFKIGRTVGACSFLQIMASELSDRMLADFLELPFTQLVNFHVESVDQAEAIKRVKRILTDIDKMKVEEQMKAVRKGYDPDIIPPDIITYADEAKKLLEDLQNRNERLFLVTILLTHTAQDRKKLENNIFQASGVAQKYNCSLVRLDYQQEQGLVSSLPVGANKVPIQRGLTTSSTGVNIPFTTQELQMKGNALYYGVNALSNNIIMGDRSLLKNPNGLILGTPGAGKSFSAKREMLNVFLITADDIIICDPEGEYFPLVEALGGQVVRIGPNSSHYVNPLDINLDYSEEENPLALKSDFILSLCELILGGKDGLQPIEKTVIDRCVRLVYRPYLDNPAPENVPILQDLWDLMRQQEEPEAKRLASALELYVTGSLNVFNHHTNVDIRNRIVCFDVKELGKELKKIGMLIVQDQVWNRVTVNRGSKVTRYYVDEFHLLLKEPQTAAYMVEIWKRFRKWGGVPTGITQNVKDLLTSMEIENILENSDCIIMLNQAPGDRKILATKLNISPHQLSYVTNSGPGEGLIFFGNVVIPFVDRFPQDTKMYRLMTTKPGEAERKVG